MRFVVFIFILFTFGCQNKSSNDRFGTFLGATPSEESLIKPEGNTVTTRIEVPDRYTRVSVKKGTFGAYLQNFPLKPDGSKVYLYNGKEKIRQDVHVAVLDISIGDKDLQQCADACMRLRAEYLWHENQFDSIRFHFTNGFLAEYSKWRQGFRIQVDGNQVRWVETKSEKSSDTYEAFLKYMQQVFMYAGTLSLAAELPKRNLSDIQMGDVFVMGGSPGHAVIVMDMAVNDTGEKVVLLAQSYMPAQNIHILKNPHDSNLSPWFDMEGLEQLETPEWNFTQNQLKSWR